MPPPYSAGSVFLQVVPSFAGVQEEIDARAERYGRAFGKKFDEGFEKETKKGLGDALDEGMKGADKKAGDAGLRAGRRYSEGFGREAGKGSTDEVNKALARQERESERAGQRAGSKYGGKFAETVKKALAGAQREIDAIKIDADTDPALAAIGEIRAAMGALRDAKIGVDLDPADAVAALSALEGLLDIIQRNAESVQVRVDAAQAMAQLSAVRTMVESLDETVEVDLKIDRKMGSFEKQVKQAVAGALDDIAPVDLQLDDSEVNQKIAAIRQELFALGDARINVDLSADEALIRLRALLTELSQLDGETADVDVRVDAAAAALKLAGIFGLVEALEKQDVDIDVDVDSSRARRGLSEIGDETKKSSRNGADAANAFRAFNIAVLAAVTLGPALVPILGAIAGGLLAIGPAAVVGIAGIGVLALGLSGISDAVTALGNKQKNAAKDAQAAAKTMRAASNGVRDAQLALDRARESAGETEESNGRRIEDALRRQQDAEERYADAQAASKKATEALTEARQESQDQLEDLSLRLRGGALAERQASLDLAKAQAAYIATMADGSATKVDREEASIALEREKIGYDEARLANQRLAEQKAKADDTGVEGTDTYQTALERVAGANKAVEDAQEGVSDATRDVADAQRENTKASRDASRAIEDAVRRQTDAQIAYSEALYDTQVLGSASAQALAEAWGKLGPEGREFALFIDGLRPQLQALREEAQAGLLPGVQEGIESFLQSSGPELMTFVSGMSQAFGDLAADAGNALGNPEWQNFFDLMNQYGPIFVEQWGAIFGNIIEGFRNILIALFPFSEEFGGGLEDLTQKWADWTAGFSDPNSGFQKFLDWVREVGPDVLTFFGNLVDAVRNILVAIAPFGEGVLGALSGLLDFIGELNPDVLGAIVIAILGIVTAFQLVNGVIAVMAGVMNLVFAGPIALVIFGLVLLGAAIWILWNQSETFRDIVLGVWDAIKTAVAFVVDWFQTSVVPILSDVWDAIAEGANWLWENILSPIFDVWKLAFGILMDFLALAWKKVGQPLMELIWSIIQDLWDIVGPILQLIGIAFGILWDLVKTYWTYVGKPIFDAFIEIITFLWKYVIDPILTLVAEAFGWLFDVIESAWNNTGKPVLDFFQAVVEGLVGVFQGSFDGIKGIWDALFNLFLAPIRFVVETVLNEGLIGGINHIASIFTSDDTWIDPIPTGWIDSIQTAGSFGPVNRAFGGVIPGNSPNKRADNIPVWATAGEYMHDVDAVNFWGLDFMEDINARRLPRVFAGAQGRAYGGMIDPLWNAVHKRFPEARFTSGYRPGDSGLHGSKQAIDVAGATRYPGGDSIVEMAKMNRELAAMFPNISQLIHTGPGAINLLDGKPHTYNDETQREHADHIHLGARNAAALAGGNVDGGGGDSWFSKAWDFISHPIDSLKKLVTDAAGNLADTKFGGMLLSIPTKFAENAADALMNFVGGVGDTVAGWFGLGDDDHMIGKSKYDAGAVKGIAQSALAGRGWNTGKEWNALETLWGKESGWNPNAQNPSSTAFGIAQLLDGTWAGTGFAKSADPRTQVLAGAQYIAARYGTPSAALAFHNAHNWYGEGGLLTGEGNGASKGELHASLYDDGGYLPPGLTMVMNATGKPEPVLTAAELELMREGGRGEGGDTFDVDFHEVMADPDEIIGTLWHEVRAKKRQGKYARTGG